MDSIEIEIDTNEIQNILNGDQNLDNVYNDNNDNNHNNDNNSTQAENTIVSQLFNFYVANLINEMENANLNEILQESFDNCNQLSKDSSKILNLDNHNVVKYKQLDDSIKKEHKNCSICFEKFYYNQNVINLDCKHLFHQKCLTEWYKYKQECPVCRKKLEQ
jgi:hypothetical protein